MTLRRTFVVDGAEVPVAAEPIGGDRWRVRVGDRVLELRATPLGDGGIRLVAGDAAACVAYGATGAGAGPTRPFMVRVAGRTHTLAVPDPRRRGGPGGGDGTVRAPMTGTILDVRCSAGDAVAADQVLVVLSAMKMEHKLVAGVAGVVRSVTAAAGATVDQDAVLVEVGQEPAPGPR